MRLAAPWWKRVHIAAPAYSSLPMALLHVRVLARAISRGLRGAP